MNQKQNLRAIYVESIGEDTSAIYVRIKGRWRLRAIINPDGSCGHPWPRSATLEEMIRWRTNCTTRPVHVFGSDVRSRTTRRQTSKS